MAKNRRVDQALVERGLAGTLEEAKRLIMAGKVRHLDQVVMKASQKITDQDEITLIPDPKYVSRGGKKLAAALEWFQSANQLDPYILFRTALAYQGLNQSDSARSYAEKAVSFNALNNLNQVLIMKPAKEFLSALD